MKPIEHIFSETDLKCFIEIVDGWKSQIDEFADGRLSTKYKYLQDEMRQVLDGLKDRLGDGK